MVIGLAATAAWPANKTIDPASIAAIRYPMRASR
jgi:hypothetical protein